MTPGLLMGIGVPVFVIAAIVLITNFSRVAADPGSMFENPKSSVGTHLGAGFVAMLGGLSALAGFAWFLLEKYAG